jgi:hypothetical protein
MNENIMPIRSAAASPLTDRQKDMVAALSKVIRDVEAGVVIDFLLVRHEVEPATKDTSWRTTWNIGGIESTLAAIGAMTYLQRDLMAHYEKPAAP